MSRTARTLLILAGLALVWISLSAARNREAALVDRTDPASLAAFQPPSPGDAGAPAEPQPNAGARRERPFERRAPAVHFNQPAPEPFPAETAAAPPAGLLQEAPAGDVQVADAAASLSSDQPTATRLPIIEYHYSTFAFAGVEMRPDWFQEQMQWLADQGFYTLTIDELAAYVQGDFRPPKRSVALTFDVGISHFDDYSEVVIPALRQNGLHGIFFVQAHGVREICDGKYACWEALAAWHAEGLISIGSHTLYHQDFNVLNPAQIAFELRRSKEIIQERLGIQAVGVCYPFDSVNPAAFAILESLGYRFAVGGWTRSERSALFQDPQPYNLPRYYPYSSPQSYPAIGGSGGLTFPEVITAAIAPAG